MILGGSTEKIHAELCCFIKKRQKLSKIKADIAKKAKKRLTKL